jgi:hypothetical protein
VQDTRATKAEILAIPTIYKWKPRKADLAKCHEFAEASDKKLYAYRGAKALDKIHSDICVGKLGELAAAEYFCSIAGGTAAEASASVKGPCFEILPTSRKSWSADLILGNGAGAHVKTMTIGSAMKFGLSWIWQKQDRAIRETQPITELCALLLATEEDIRLLVVQPIEEIKPLLKPLRIAHWTSKCALYFEDLQK